MVMYSERWSWGKASDRGRGRREWVVCARNATWVNKRWASYCGVWGRGVSFPPTQHNYKWKSMDLESETESVFFSLFMLMMFHLRRCTSLPRFLWSVLDSLLLCCFGSHYSFCFLLSCNWESLQFVAFGRFGSEPVSPFQNGRVLLHRRLFVSAASLTWFCFSLSQSKVQARSLPTISSKQSHIFMPGKETLCRKVLGAAVRGSKSKVNDGTTTRSSAAGLFCWKGACAWYKS